MTRELSEFPGFDFVGDCSMKALEKSSAGWVYENSVFRVYTSLLLMEYGGAIRTILGDKAGFLIIGWMLVLVCTGSLLSEIFLTGASSYCAI